jgi:hypothetical protein
MDKYKWKALEDLIKSLNATNVLSADYKQAILAFVFLAVGEAYQEGKKVGEDVR